MKNHPVRNLASRETLIAALAVASLASAGRAQAPAKRAITVNDAIAMTRLADPLYFGGAPLGNYKVAEFSPDNTQFVVILRTADTQNNSNVYKMYLFSARNAFKHEKQNLICEMSSSSNTPAITDAKWLSDNRRIAFLGAKGPGGPQVYVVDTKSREITQRTHHPSALKSFDIAADGKTIAFIADPRVEDANPEPKEGNEWIVNGHRLIDALTGRGHMAARGRDLFIQTGDKEQRYEVPQGYLLSRQHGKGIWISPSGSYIAILMTYRRANPEWAHYDDKALQLWASRAIDHDTDDVGESEIFIAETKRHAMASAANAPASLVPDVRWSSDERSMYAKTFLPLSRSKTIQTVSINLQSHGVEELSAEQWMAAVPHSAQPTITVDLEEDINSPPRLFVHSMSGERKAMLMDLNPQFRELEFGQVRPLTLSIRGINVDMGVYLPAHYNRGERYPLVIQTHGFDRDRFSMDGMDEWSTGFAARPLAAKGFVVLQTLSFTTPEDAAKYQLEPSLGATPAERARELEKEAYDAAIDALDLQGLIDRDRVGISGFSITVMFTAFTLTHSTHHFAAAAIADGVDGGYFQYLAEENHQFEEYTDGTPFTGVGLQHWLKESPSFSMGKVDTPVRVVALNRKASLLTMWEWYAALEMQNKPVDFVSLRDAAHTMERPCDRRIAMEGLADWFAFWLQGYENTDPSKAEQYKRWEHLRKMQEPNTKAIQSSAP